MTISHLEQKAFVRKYNSELAIKGYTKLTKASLFQRIENTLKRSRTELKREWASMKSRPSADSNMAVKRGPKRSEVKPVSAKRASAMRRGRHVLPMYTMSLKLLIILYILPLLYRVLCVICLLR